MSTRFLVAFYALGLCLSSSVIAQDEAAKIDKSRIPAQADNPAQFAPAGWKIEEQVTGDLNGDSIPDYALKLVEDKPEKNTEGDPTERGRALVLALATTDGKLKLAGVADSLLQCTRCGGAFYGVVESPANVKIEKGVVIVEQDHGSREVTDTTYRFRFDRTSERFVLIGFDLTDVDRATASVVTESINYLTGVRVVTRGKGDKDVKTRTTISKRRIYLEDASADDLESAAYKRLKL
ncbi:MAG TPA: hypothetical protein VGJ69_11320 [Pyrinomonadaceae bacterium]